MSLMTVTPKLTIGMLVICNRCMYVCMYEPNDNLHIEQKRARKMRNLFNLTRGEYCTYSFHMYKKLITRVVELQYR